MTHSANWVNGTDLCPTSHWGIGSKDCPTAYWVIWTDLDPNAKCLGEGRATQEQMSRKATRQLNTMARHKNAPALGQGEEETRAASGQSTEPLG